MYKIFFSFPFLIGDLTLFATMCLRYLRQDSVNWECPLPSGLFSRVGTTVDLSVNDCATPSAAPTPPDPAPKPTKEPPSDDKTLVIVACTLGGVLFAVLIVGGVVMVIRKKKWTSKRTNVVSPSPSPMVRGRRGRARSGSALGMDNSLMDGENDGSDLESRPVAM